MRNKILQTLTIIVIVCTFLFLITGIVLYTGQPALYPDTVALPIATAELTNGALPNFFDDEPDDILAKKIVNAMTPEELLSQCFMFGWAGQNPNELVGSWVDAGLGSIKIFGWNTADTFKLTAAIAGLQQRALASRFGIPLFVATDQEGGVVRHVKGLTTETPGALACGASGIPQDSYYAGYYIGLEMAAIGININFAPTVDLYTNHASTVIASRSFGDNPEYVARLTIAFAQGLKDAGLLATAKHFPGHGDTELDSHGYLPRIDISYDVFEKRELQPFKLAIESGIPCIMAGHLNFPQFMKENEPATFSRDMLQGLLRERLGFHGLIITDDLMMHSALRYSGNFSRAVTLALKAGNNIIESSTTPRLTDAVWHENIVLMKNDPAFFQTVKESTEKILKYKLAYFKNKKASIVPDPLTVASRFPVEHSEDFFTTLAAHSVTVIMSCKPIPQNTRLLVLSDLPKLFTSAKKFFPNAVCTTTDNYFQARDFDTIIFCIYDEATRERFIALAKTFPDKTFHVVSALSPVTVQGLSNMADSLLATYSYSEFSFNAAAATLAGQIIPQGTMPLESLQF